MVNSSVDKKNHFVSTCRKDELSEFSLGKMDSVRPISVFLNVCSEETGLTRVLFLYLLPMARRVFFTFRPQRFSGLVKHHSQEDIHLVDDTLSSLVWQSGTPP